LAADLSAEIKDIFKENWSVAEGQVIPDPKDLGLSNDAKRFERATVLYADLSGSTVMVDTKSWAKCGEIYKSFLTCSARIIKHCGGTITAYDGDRIMSIFTGSSQTTNAADCALKINWSVKNIINPAFKNQYNEGDYTIKHTAGIDTGELRAARIGIRGQNDLVWIGRAANYAALAERRRLWRPHQTAYSSCGMCRLWSVAGPP
jgi:class 3 adenylate cyclase